jgi:hypothetical protein
MITKKIASITIVIALAAMFFSSSAFVNPLMAKTADKSNDDSKDKTKDTSKDTPKDDSTSTSTLTNDPSSSDNSKDKTKDTSKDDSTSTSTSSSSAERDFKDFQKCISDAMGTKGFATNQEIKGCYNPIYHTLTTVSTTTTHKTVKPIDFSTPLDFSKKSSSSSNDQ